MRTAITLLLIAGLPPGRSALAQDSTIVLAQPPYASFPAPQPYAGPIHLPDRHSRVGRTFRTAIRLADTLPPTLAGHYAVAEWGCGVSCRTGAAIDLRTGQVLPFPHPASSWAYRPDSRLLVADPTDQCYEWDAYSQDPMTPAHSVWYELLPTGFVPRDSVDLLCRSPDR
jgi:hypothetical protein